VVRATRRSIGDKRVTRSRTILRAAIAGQRNRQGGLANLQEPKVVSHLIAVDAGETDAYHCYIRPHLRRRHRTIRTIGLDDHAIAPVSDRVRINSRVSRLLRHPLTRISMLWSVTSIEPRYVR
jgi:hypothetical protein